MSFVFVAATRQCVGCTGGVPVFLLDCETGGIFLIQSEGYTISKCRTFNNLK